MQTVAHLVERAKLQAMASVDTFKQGQEIVEGNGVMMEPTNPLKVTAKVTSPGGTIQHTMLASTPGGLHWECSCGEQNFCAHLVATALVAGQKISKHHRNPKADEQVV